MIKKIKEKLREPFFIEDLLIDYVRPAVLGLIGAAIGIAISYMAGWLYLLANTPRKERNI